MSPRIAALYLGLLGFAFVGIAIVVRRTTGNVYLARVEYVGGQRWFVFEDGTRVQDPNQYSRTRSCRQPGQTCWVTRDLRQRMSAPPKVLAVMLGVLGGLFLVLALAALVYGR